jgi:hypothetical protein
LLKLKKKSKLVAEKREGAQTLLPVFLSQFGLNPSTPFSRSTRTAALAKKAASRIKKET